MLQADFLNCNFNVYVSLRKHTLYHRALKPFGTMEAEATGSVKGGGSLGVGGKIFAFVTAKPKQSGGDLLCFIGLSV